MCLKDSYYRNEEFLSAFFHDRAVPFWAFEKPHARPAVAGSGEEDVKMLNDYYLKLDRGGGGGGGADGEGEPSMRDVARVLEEQHDSRIKELEGMPRRTLDSVWWPFTQHGLVSRVRAGGGGHAVFLISLIRYVELILLPSPSCIGEQGGECDGD